MIYAIHPGFFDVITFLAKDRSRHMDVFIANFFISVICIGAGD